MALPSPADELDATTAMADLWLLHCEALQAEVERLKQQNDRLLRGSKPPTVEQPSIASFKNHASGTTLEALVAEICKNPRNKQLSHRFALLLSTTLLLNPGTVCARIAAGGDWAQALKLAIPALEHIPLRDQLARVYKFRCGNELRLTER